MKKPEMEPGCASELAPPGLLELPGDVAREVDGQGLEEKGGLDSVQRHATEPLEPCQSGCFRYGLLDP